MEHKLPYVFDLLFDIKTTTQLRNEYLQAKQLIRDIEEVCKDTNIELDLTDGG